MKNFRMKNFRTVIGILGMLFACVVSPILFVASRIFDFDFLASVLVLAFDFALAIVFAYTASLVRKRMTNDKR